MTANLAPQPVWRLYDNVATLAVGGKVYTYQAGTTTPQVTYTDATGGTPNTNPIICNSRGEFQMWLGAGLSYKIVAQDAAGNTLWTVDGVSDEAELLAQSLSGSGGSALIGFIQDGSGAVARTAQAKLRDAPVTPSDFGAVGNDSTDDTVAMQDSFAANTAGRTLVLERGKTYLIASDELVMLPGSSLDGNGATLHFTHTNPSKRCLAVLDGCSVRNLSVNKTSVTAGTDGSLQTPITVGQYTSTTGCKGWTISGVQVQTALPDGNCIGVFSDSSDGVIENIYAPTSTTVGRVVMLHWAFDGGPTTPYTGITKHPHNIRITNIRAGSLSNGTSGSLNQSLVFLSGCYNVDVSNIYADEVVHGKMATVYAGDWGFQFGTTVEKAMGLSGISVRNLGGQCLIGVHVYGMDNGSQAAARVWPGSVDIENVSVYGITGDSASEGLRPESCDCVSARRCVFDSFYNAVYLGGVVTNFTLDECSLRQSVQHAFTASGALTGSASIRIRNNQFIGTNTSASSNIADIYLTNIAGANVEDNTFNSSNALWNLRCENTCTRVKVFDNHTLSVNASGLPYSFGISTDTAIVNEFYGNTSDAAPAAGLRAGQVFIPITGTMKLTSNDVPSISLEPSVPDRGTWSKGSVVVLGNAPASGQPWVYLRMTTGSANVLGTDWKVAGNMP